MSLFFKACACGGSSQEEGGSDLDVCTVFGATGLQGGSVARELARTKRFSELRLVSRDVKKEALHQLAVEITKLGVNVRLVQCDLNSPAQVKIALEGATHSFLVTNWPELFFANGAKPGKEGFEAGRKAGEIELAQGKNWVDACKECNLQFVIYSGLENVEKLTKGLIPNVYHFNFKGQVEEYMWKQLPGRACSVRLGFYLENFKTHFVPDADGTLRIPIGHDPIGCISVADTGKVVDGIFKEGPHKWAGKALGVSSQNLTGRDIAVVWSQAIGKPVIFEDIPAEVYGSLGFPMDAELAEMFMFFRDQKLFVRDPEATQRVATGKLTTWEEFAAANKKELTY